MVDEVSTAPPIFKKRTKRDVQHIIKPSNSVEAKGKDEIEENNDEIVKRRKINDSIKNTTLQSSTIAQRSFGKVEDERDEIEQEKFVEENEQEKEDNEEEESNSNKSNKITNDDGLYHGVSAYSKFTAPPKESLKKEKFKPQSSLNRSNLKITSVMDYQPRICKDFKETGYCGFGDSCIFLHDRSDYLKSGLKNAQQDNQIDKIEPDKNKPLPFACLICRKSFKNPIKTICQHYFCSDCALKRFKKGSTKCFACGKQTQGIFSNAENDFKKVNLKPEKEREEDVEDDEDD